MSPQNNELEAVFNNTIEELVKHDEGSFSKIISEALKRVRSISKEYDGSGGKDQFVSELAQRLIKFGRPDISLKTSKYIKDSEEKADVLATVAEGFSGIGRFDDALGVAKAISRRQPGYKCQAIHGIVLNLAKAGLLEKALEAVDGIKDEMDRETILGSLASFLVESGQFNAAKKIVKSTKNRQIRENLLEVIALPLIKVGRLDEGLKTVRAISSIESREEKLKEIVNWLVKTGQFKKALKAVSVMSEDEKNIWIGEIIETVPCDGGIENIVKSVKRIKNKGDKDSLLKSIAERFTYCGEHKKALEIAKSIHDKELRAIALEEVRNTS